MRMDNRTSMATTDDTLGAESRVPGPPTVLVLRSADELEAERARWDVVPWGRVDAQLDYFLAVLRTRTEAERPHVVLVERDGRVVAALAGRVERAPLECSVGYKVVYRPVLRSMTVVHGGLVAGDAEAARILVGAVDEALHEREFEVASFPSLPAEGELRAVIDATGPRVRHGGFAARRPHHRLVMADTLEAWLSTWPSKSRYKLRRQARLFEEAFPGELSVRLLSSVGEYDRIFADLEAVAATTYQRGLGVGFRDTPLFREIVRVSLEKGWFRAWVVYRGETPIAFWQGYVAGGTFFSANMGYDSAYADYSPGTYLMTNVFEDLFADPDVRVVDYGLGDADYKRRFGNETWDEQDVLLFAPTARAVRVNLTRSAILAGGEAARRALDRTGATARVKKLWRSRLRSAA